MAKRKPPTLPPLVPPRGSPFLGISGTNAPAKNTKVKDLTEKVTLAKTRKAALTHGGLLTPEQQKAASEAGKALAAHKAVKRAATPEKRAPQSVSKPLAKAPLGDSTPSKPLPLPTSAPFKVPLPTAPAPALPTSPTGRRGSPRQQLVDKQPKQHGLGLGSLTSAASTGLGTAVEGALSIPSTLLTPIHPGATHTAAEDVKPTKLSQATTDVSNASARLGANVASVGVHGGIPHGFTIPSIDLVPPAGAAGPNRPITADEYKRLEAQGFDLKPRLKKRFTAMALKNGYTQAELDGVSGSRRIDMAFTKPPSKLLRILGNAAGDIAQFGTVPAGVEGAVRETAAGHGLQVAQALGEGLYSQLPVVGKHPFGQTVQAHPFQALTQFAGLGKATGAVAGLGRAGNTARVVEAAGSGLKIERGNLSKNAYDATRELASDKLASNIPRFGARLERENLDKMVRFRVNQHAEDWKTVQVPYKKALDKVGNKRAAELLGYQQSGGKPEQIAAFFRSQGNKDNAKFYDRVAANTQTLSEDDQAYLHAHAAVAAKTTQGKIAIGKFSDTGAEFRRYSPLIRSSAHLGDPEAQRILALRDEYLKGFNTMPEQDVAALRGAIDQGVQDYAQKHIASGGKEPAYVEYSQPKPLIAPPYKPGVGGTTGFKKPRGKQMAETGATFEGGKYLIDPKAPLVESIRAQRQHLADVLHEDVSKAVGQHVTAGDTIPDGHVFVSETNLRGLKRTTNDLADNPVSAPDYEEFANQTQSIFDRLRGAAVPSTERVPRGEKGYVLPIASWKRILDHTRPPSRNQYDHFMGQYQRVLIGYRPSTFFNNAVGSPILASTFGAGPKSYLKAIESAPSRSRLTRDILPSEPEIAAPYVSGHGVAGGLAPNPRSKVGTGFDWSRHQSAKAEDFSRRAVYFRAVLPGSKKRAKELGYPNQNAYLRDVAAGKVDTHILNKGLDRAAKALGDALTPNGPFGRAAGRTILFHNWVGHMAKMLLYTLPVEHPIRLTVLNELANYGDQYRQEHGVWPDWYASYLPLFQHVKRLGLAGVPQVFTKAYNTGGVNPFATLNNFADPVSTNQSAGNIALGLANPVISTAGKTLFARPYDSTSAGRFLAGQIVRQIPGVSVVRPQGGMASDSIPFISEKQKVYSSGKKRHGKSVPLPYDFRPGARAEPGVKGALERWLFGGVSDLPAQGPVHNIEQKKHIGAVAKAARHR